MTMLAYMEKKHLSGAPSGIAGFYTSALERGNRPEQSVNLALAEMCMQGASTRKVIEVPQRLVGPAVNISLT